MTPLTVGAGMNGYYDRDCTNVLIGGRAMMCCKAFQTKDQYHFNRGMARIGSLITTTPTGKKTKIVFGAGIAGSDLQVTRPGTMW